jgi:hypothetical protein
LNYLAYYLITSSNFSFSSVTSTIGFGGGAITSVGFLQNLLSRSYFYCNANYSALTAIS